MFKNYHWFDFVPIFGLLGDILFDNPGSKRKQVILVIINIFYAVGGTYLWVYRILGL